MIHGAKEFFELSVKTTSKIDFGWRPKEWVGQYFIHNKILVKIQPKVHNGQFASNDLSFGI